MLDRFLRGLDLVIGKEVLKENPSTFDEACILAERIARLTNLVNHKTHRVALVKHDPNGYAPIDLDSLCGQNRKK